MGREGEEHGAAMAGRAAAAAAAAREKSSFAVTCSLLSQYLKEKKGGLHGLGLGMAPPASAGVFRPPTTMNLLSSLDSPAEESNDAAKTTAEPRPSDSIELSLEKATTEPPVLVAPTAQNGEHPREAVGDEAQQLTIFYDGKVVVFDNFPPTKVKDLLQIVHTGDGVDMANGSAAPQNLPRPSQNSLSADLPIARRNSLHRFLEKRKGRIIAKAPYQVNSSVEASKQANGEKSWLGLGQEVKTKQEI